MSHKKRIFVAIDISDDVRTALVGYMNRLQTFFPNVKARWVAPENLHITVWFVGNTDADRLARWEQSVRLAANYFAPFDIDLEGTGHFAQRRTGGSALWIGAVSTPVNVFKEIAMALADDKRVFPHVTIARLKRSPQGEPLISKHLSASFGPLSFRVNELVIYEGTLTRDGSVYSVLSKHELEGNP